MSRFGRFFTPLAMLLCWGTSSLPAQHWPGTCTILETSGQPGDSATLIISVGEADDPVSPVGSITVVAPYNSSLLNQIGPGELDVENSFFVAAGVEYSYTIKVDDSLGEITLIVDLKSPNTGSGYGELARIRGLMEIEDVFKRAEAAPGPDETRVLAYPNPTRGMLTVALPGEHGGVARLVNASGAMVWESTFAPGQTQLHADLSGLAAGPCLLVIQSGEMLFREKVAIW